MKILLRHIFSPLLLLAALLCSSCERLPQSSGGGEGEETVVIRIGPAETKSAKDGDLMVNLRVWMVDGSDKVVKYASQSPGAATATVTFDKVDRGAYTLYFLANSTALGSYVENSTIDNAFLKATLTKAGTAPEYTDTEGMPLSLAKSVSIGPGVNRVSAELIRVCGLVNITVKNRSADKALYISSVSLSDRNPSSGYVFQQSDHSSPSGTTYGAFPSATTLTRIEPADESKVQTFYLFENCGSSETIQFTLQGGLYDRATSVSSVDKNGYHATGPATNTGINTSKYYFLASAFAQRHFLKADDSTGALTLQEVGSDAELFVKSDVRNYLWQFGSTGTSTSVKNVGKETYLDITITDSGGGGGGGGGRYSATYRLSGPSSTLRTATSTGRQFYQRSSGGSPRYSYLYNNSGTIGVTAPSTSTSSEVNTGWYLREASEYTYKVLSPTPEKAIDITTPLTYTDSYGIAQPLTSICRNDRLEVVVNVFYNPLTGTFDFQVESWRTKDNRTTFD